MRGQGDLAAASAAYERLADGGHGRWSARAIHGLGACHLEVGSHERAAQLAQMAMDQSPDDHGLMERGRILFARAGARTDLPAATSYLQNALSRSVTPGSARAHGRLVLGDMFLLAGAHGRALREIRLARADARALDAPRTLADALRLEAEMYVRLGDQAKIGAAMRELVHAENLYRGIGDQGICALLLCRGNAHRALGQNRMAERELMRASVLASGAQNQIIHAHALLALADLARVSGDPDPEKLRRASAIYRRISHERGIHYCHLLLGLGAASAGRPEVAAQAFASVAAHADATPQIFTDADRRLVSEAAAGSLDSRPIAFAFLI